MKSKSQDKNKTLTTSCKECMFAVYDGITQTGCEMDRLKKFKACDDAIVSEAMDDDKEFFILNRACNYFRAEGTETNAKVVRHQGDMGFGVVVDISDCSDLRPLRATLYSLLDIKYSLAKWGIIIVHDKNIWNDVESRNGLAGFRNTLVKTGGIYTEVLVTLEDRRKDFDSFKAAHNLGISYVTRIKPGDKVGERTFQKINGMINNDMKKVVTFSTEDADFILFRALNMYYPQYNCYDTLISNVKEESKLQGLHIDL